MDGRTKSIYIAISKLWTIQDVLLFAIINFNTTTSILNSTPHPRHVNNVTSQLSQILQQKGEILPILSHILLQDKRENIFGYRKKLIAREASENIQGLVAAIFLKYSRD